jgi:hypothetical protein
LAPLIPFIPLIAAGVGAAATGIELANEPKAPAAPTIAQTSTQQAEAGEAAAQAQAIALTKRRGMAATTLTSPTGAGSANIQKATLGA